MRHASKPALSRVAGANDRWPNFVAGPLELSDDVEHDEPALVVLDDEPQAHHGEAGSRTHLQWMTIPIASRDTGLTGGGWYFPIASRLSVLRRFSRLPYTSRHPVVRQQLDQPSHGPAAFELLDDVDQVLTRRDAQ